MIVWTSDYDTGIRQIDLQHQELVELINEAAAAHAGGGDMAALEQILLKLKTYVFFHFGTEESLLNGVTVSRDHALAHRAAHKQFTDRISELKLAADNGDTSALPELIDYLQHWLIEHIMKTDKDLGKMLRSTDRRDRR